MRRARGLSARFARSRTAYPGPCVASRKCGAPSGAACGEWRNSEAMARSLKKGPFVDGHLREKVEALNTRNEKKVERPYGPGSAPSLAGYWDCRRAACPG